MALELVIVGRRPLPKGKRPWTFELEFSGDDVDDEDDEPHDGILDEGSLIMYEPDQDDHEFREHVAAVVGFEPAVILCIRPAGWEMSTITAEIVAHAVEGVVYCFEGSLELDAKGDVQPAKSIKDLEKRIHAAFEHPAPWFERWEREAQEEYTREVARNPQLAAENDWSDV